MTTPEPLEYEHSPLTLADAAPVIGRALNMPPEDVAGFIVIGVSHGGAVGWAGSENIDPHTAAHVLENIAAVVLDDIAARQGKAGQN